MGMNMRDRHLFGMLFAGHCRRRCAGHAYPYKIALGEPRSAWWSVFWLFPACTSLLDAPFVAIMQVIVYAGRDHDAYRVRHHDRRFATRRPCGGNAGPLIGAIVAT